jgi:hypothetical protein
VIRNRLSFRIIWEDFRERFLDYDNSFLITFAQLIYRPENVINGYISGVRKRYMDPLSYLGIALTLSGIQLFIMRKVADKINWDIYNQEINPELTSKVSEISFDYSSFMFVVFIPVFAMAGWLAFNRKHYLYSECIILFTYALAHWSIVLFLPNVVVLVLAPELYLHLAMPLLLVMIGYSLYCMQRIHRYTLPRFSLRAGIYFILAFMGYIGIIAVFYAILFATGTISVGDFAPQN